MAKRLVNDETGEPLDGEPDARVLEKQREADAWRIGNLDAWRRTSNTMWQMNEQARIERNIEKNMEKAEEMVWVARRKDLHHEAPVQITKDIPSDG